MSTTVTDRPMLVDADKAAAILDCGRSTIYRMIRSGTLDTVKLGRSRRITMESIERVARQGWKGQGA